MLFRRSASLPFKPTLPDGVDDAKYRDSPGDLKSGNEENAEGVGGGSMVLPCPKAR